MIDRILPDRNRRDRRPDPDPDPDRFFDRTARCPRVVVLRRHQRRRPRRPRPRLVRRPAVRPRLRRGHAPPPQGPAKHPAPRALDHSAIGFSWYRDGKTVGLCPERPQGRRLPPPGRPVRRRGRGAAGSCATGGLPPGRRHARRSTAPRSGPSSASAPPTRPSRSSATSGTPGPPHHWILAAADCRVEGRVAVGPKRVDLAFRGRGYHDHNAGARSSRSP